jgi:hypothetical protein
MGFVLDLRWHLIILLLDEPLLTVTGQQQIIAWRLFPSQGLVESISVLSNQRQQESMEELGMRPRWAAPQPPYRDIIESAQRRKIEGINTL